MRKWLCLSFFFLGGCVGQKAWLLQSIPTQEKEFYLTKLVTQDLDFSSLELELFSNLGKIEAILITKGLPLSSKTYKVCLTIDEKNCEDEALVFQGGMKLKLSEKMTQSIIESLLEGKKIDILLDGFSKTLSPDQFAENFLKLERR